MIDYLQTFILAVVQGFTEFLPISSSGHLILVPALLGWPDQGLAFDVAVHVGSLLAVMLYFRREIVLLVRDWVGSLCGRPTTAYSRLAWAIGLSMIFVGIAGFYGEEIINQWLRQPIPIALATIGFGLLLWWADYYGKRERSIEEIRWRDVVVIGIAQAIALIPGTSRSGITMTAGLIVGLTREAAARFSFLMGIPVILLAGLWKGRSLASGEVDVDWGILITAIVVSAVVAFICIHWFLGFLRRFSLLPFVIYRCLLGLFLLWWFL